jgi:hypothetical protein
VPERKLFAGSAQIIDLARVRAARAQTPRGRRAVRSPRIVLAIGLTIGVAGGILLMRAQSGQALTQYQHGALLAQGALAQALNQQLVGHTPSGASIRVSSTYRARNGNYCRTFAVAGSQSLGGLACRLGDQWQVQTLLSNGGPSSLLDLNRGIGGTPLGFAAESQLRAHDWQPSSPGP